MRRKHRNVCFVTGSRAEFGLMQKVLRAIEHSPRLTLQLIVTGMHLDKAHGAAVGLIGAESWKIDRIVPWKTGSSRDRIATARNTGSAIADLTDAFDDLSSDIVLVVGDRVEAFAAASAAHLSGRIVAHVHGGDRAIGQADDSLRHAITKLAHVHFPATQASAKRIHKLGEDLWRIHLAGAPGIEGIVEEATSANAVNELDKPRRKTHSALIVLHPIDADESLEARRAQMILSATQSIPFDRIDIVYPNNDPGAGGIIGIWDRMDRKASEDRVVFHRNLPRGDFLRLMKDASVLIGNSSSGIIEAASFGTPVIDIGPRQMGREHGTNVAHVPYEQRKIRMALSRIWSNGRPRRFKSDNIYGGKDTSRKIVRILSSIPIDDRLWRKLIRY